MATMMHPFQKTKIDNNSMKVFFCIKNIKQIWHNKKVKCSNDSYIYFADKSVVRGPKPVLIITPLEVYIGKMLIFNPICLTCICVAYKCHQNIFWALDY